MMERLTEHCCPGGIRIKGCSALYSAKERKGAPASNAIVRLAAYEDAMPLERAQELAQAEKDGRMVVLPCKVGDTVYHKNPYANARVCAFRQAFELILDAPTIAPPPNDPPPNDPLTLEELREMDGDKVSIHYIDGFYTDEDGAYFGKFEQLVRECNGRLTACELPLKYYGKTWLAYRRKPEEG